MMILALLLSASSPTPAMKVNDAATVRVECPNSVGTAVSLGGGRYLTAAHVVRTPGCRVDGVPVENVQLYPTDFATFTSKPSDFTAKIDCSGFKPDKSYLAVGYAFGAKFLTYEPLIAADFQIDGQQTFVGEIIPGMSGGPVFNGSGEVVGVVSRRWPARSTPLRGTVLCD